MEDRRCARENTTAIGVEAESSEEARALLRRARVIDASSFRQSDDDILPRERHRRRQ
jgi:DNA-dependent RNA polymerase auxiliary subunit epsilon